MRELLFLILVLACPAAMLLMMRGGHGHGGHRHASSDHGGAGRLSADELRMRRDELDRQIEERERADAAVASDPASLRSLDDGERRAGAAIPR